MVSVNVWMEIILEMFLDSVIVLDFLGYVIDFNVVVECMFGYKFEDIKGKLIWDLIVLYGMCVVY